MHWYKELPPKICIYCEMQRMLLWLVGFLLLFVWCLCLVFCQFTCSTVDLLDCIAAEYNLTPPEVNLCHISYSNYSLETTEGFCATSQPNCNFPEVFALCCNVGVFVLGKNDITCCWGLHYCVGFSVSLYQYSILKWHQLLCRILHWKRAWVFVLLSATQLLIPLYMFHTMKTWNLLQTEEWIILFQNVPACNQSLPCKIRTPQGKH